MIETSEILDLTEVCPLRSNDDQHPRHGFTNSGIATPSSRQHSLTVSAHISLQNIEEMTPKDESDANSVLDTDYKDVKIGFDELCPVCGDKVSGYHYGLLTCESCKGFFKRTVQNKKIYSCVDNRNCQIDKSQRKRCPFCRFQKCLSVGMKLEAVRSDRMRGGRNKFGPMYKRDRALKQQAARQVQVLLGSSDDLPALSNGILELGSPESPEDVKPDIHKLQASLNIYPGGMPNSVTSNTASGLISGPNCLSTAAAASSSSSSSSSGPDPMSPSHVHPHHTPETEGQVSHQMHVPVTVTPQNFTQNFVHVSVSPKTYYSQQQQQHRHGSSSSQQHHKGNNNNNNNIILDHGDPGSPSHRHQQLLSCQSSPDFQMTDAPLCSQNPQHRSSRTGSAGTLGSLGHENESSYPSVIEALRVLHGSSVTGHSECSKISLLIAEIKATMVDESEVKHKMLTFMQNELSVTDISSNPEQFLPVLCRMVDQLLFLMVEWARNSAFFKEIKVEDQMKLLHNSWSEILILDFIYRQIHNLWGKEILMPNGDVIGFDILDKLGLGDVRAKVFELIKKGRELKMDFNEYMCLKFLILLNPDVSDLENRSFVEHSQERVNAALYEYCVNTYPSMGDKFSQLLMRLPEIRVISIRTEDFLYFKHLSNEVPDQTLLTEMLHAKWRG